MPTLLLLGGGGHCKVVADVARACGYTIIGGVDVDPSKMHTQIEPGGTRVTMSQDDLFAHIDAQQALPQGVDALALCVGNNAIRQRIMQRLQPQWLPRLVHPTAIISQSATLGHATVVLPYVIVNAHASVGAGVILNTRCTIEHDCVVGDAVHVSPSATLCGDVHVGEVSWIGAGSVTIQGRRIGHHAMVGAGSTVIHDVPDHTTVVGSPARTPHATRTSS